MPLNPKTMARNYHISFIVFLCLLHISAKGQVAYRSMEVERLAKTLKVNADSLHEGQNSFMVNDRRIWVRFNGNTVSSIGYSLFSDDLKFAANTPILDFLERYFLSLDYPEADRPSARKIREERFKFEVGSMATISDIRTDDSFSYGYEKNRYTATWTREGHPLLSVSFPANHELISGENKIENEKHVEMDILSARIYDVEPVNEELLTPTMQKDYYVKKGSTYLNKKLTSDLYYQRHDSIFTLLADDVHPLESSANLMLSLESLMDCKLKIKQVMYGYKKKYFDAPLRNWIAYCRNNGCELYFGVESFDEKMILATIFAVNVAENYNHMLYVQIPQSVISAGTGDIESRLQTFVPMHNVTNLFAKYDHNKKKIPIKY